MIHRIILWSVKNRVLVVLLSLMLLLLGLYAVKQTPVDAIPDLSDVQVIVKTSYPGQAPEVVQEQITYPLTTALMAVPGAQVVRGFSFFGDSYVYIIFDDDTDIYWARSRVLEYLSQLSGQLPSGVQPLLGPDATGVGWVFIYALADRTGQTDLAELRRLQDWLLKFELQSVEGVSEVAVLGGMVKQYQVQLNPAALMAHKLSVNQVIMAIRQANQQSGASVIEQAEAEYMVNATGYIRTIQELENVPLPMATQKADANETLPLLLIKDIAKVREVPEMRRGIAELNGEGEVVGGIIVMRYGENAQAVIQRVKAKLRQIRASLPGHIDIIPVYDRSELIESAVDNLWQKLSEEFLAVILVCAAFLLHFRSSLVILFSLPLGILTAFILMKWQGLNANIMSLGGIAIAIGAMVDGAIVMIENLHKHLEKEPDIRGEKRWQLVIQSCQEVGPALFFSLLIITLSFLPVFVLEAQEGRLFSPLAFTKTYAMAAAAILAITLVPVLLGYLVTGNIRSEQHNPLNRLLVHAYLPVLSRVLNWPKITLLLVSLIALSAVYPLQKLGSEFMPPLDEGDLMYMPTTYPGLSIGEARQILQQTDRLIRSVPEVKNVFGKIGRAETATDPAPLTMIETFIQFKPKEQWRAGMTAEKLRQELDQKVQFPGLTNAWVMPIKTRIDMLATGIKTPVGIKIAGDDLATIQAIGEQVEAIIKPLPGTLSVYAERTASGRYLQIDIDRIRAAQYGLSLDSVQQILATAVGGRAIDQSIQGLERYAISVRYPQSYRNSLSTLKELPLITTHGQVIRLAEIAEIEIKPGPAMIKSENGRINGWLFIDIQGVDLGQYVQQAQQVIETALGDKTIDLPAGYSINWAGQYEYLLRAEQKLNYVVPLTLLIITILLFLSFGRIAEVMMILLTLPLSLVGGLWLMWWLDFNFSVAVGVGFIALAGVAVEIGVIMLVYLNQAYQQALQQAKTETRCLEKAQLQQAVIQGAGLRLRPIAMTVATIAIGLLPVLYSGGTGSEVMSRIAAPMIGGTISALLLTLVVLPVIYYLWRSASLNQHSK
ncbi:efflux RND transporter permease subunit [Bacterioplanoides sp. SCSIO 12839]|uniref:efflux RND transporter permease subunit n=1 Tax=Bacterioplanoides sp. SCSIO 12839 TaxID=2829569 RepID=UPI002104DB5A|nr:CusA/CzcA family heavy metal efflux RND transporter [Bacterioplanoides sp. SCSIO 12839]UTW47598.1 efflux RND transporter permease subunit [Bacterioplanoides sp. SCSIO 12839]